MSENEGGGVIALSGGTVTLARAEEGKPQTVYKDNGFRDWSMDPGSEIIGTRRTRSTSENQRVLFEIIFTCPAWACSSTGTPPCSPLWRVAPQIERAKGEHVAAGERLLAARGCSPPASAT